MVSALECYSLARGNAARRLRERLRTIRSRPFKVSPFSVCISRSEENRMSRVESAEAFRRSGVGSLASDRGS